MPTTLTIREATVQTVQVEIKALKIGKKQVTMGLFRQLPREPLIDGKTVQLRGVPWGHVNYWWDGAAKGYVANCGESLHCVWQLGDVLYRDIVFEKPPRNQTHQWEDREKWLRTDLFLQQLPSMQDISAFRFPTGSTDPVQHRVRVDGETFDIQLTREASQIVHDYCQWRDTTNGQNPYAEQYVKQQRQAAVDAYEHLTRGIHTIPTDEYHSELTEVRAKIAGYRHRWTQQWETLCALPQLFIAV